MKSLLVLIVGLMTVGCITPEQPLEPSQLSAEPSPANSPPNPTDQNTTKEGPVKELTPTDQNASRAEPVKELTPEEQKALRDSVVGEYTMRARRGDTIKMVLLNNGFLEWYENGKRWRSIDTPGDIKWSMSNREIHVKIPNRSLINTYGIYNYKNKGITHIHRLGTIVDGKRNDWRASQTAGFWFKKIK